ncbi:MAG: hypothetical protein PHV32_04365 [Eubacteriales bacterium]|nr:hypothetical protein [Eubacteriales bacterium]
MKKSKMDFAIVVVGIILLGVGLYLVKSIIDPQGFMKAFPYVCVGLGCGLFGHGMGNIISHKAIQTDPNIEKQLEIDKKDERNIAISSKAKSKAFDLMTFVFGALMIAFALMEIDLVAVPLLVFAYLFVQGCAIYYRCKYDKEM